MSNIKTDVVTIFAFHFGHAKHGDTASLKLVIVCLSYHETTNSSIIGHILIFIPEQLYRTGYDSYIG